MENNIPKILWSFWVHCDVVWTYKCIWAIFQQPMNDVIYEISNDFMVYYIDDIFIFSKHLKKHEWHVWFVLTPFTHLT
jgi:hypothetical protein